MCLYYNVSFVPLRISFLWCVWERDYLVPAIVSSPYHLLLLSALRNALDTTCFPSFVAFWYHRILQSLLPASVGGEVWEVVISFLTFNY